jgi:transposase-like protein
METGRRKHTPEEKVAILRRHLVEKESVSCLCVEYQIHPTVFYRWLKVFFENGAAAFQRQPDAARQREADPPS